MERSSQQYAPTVNIVLSYDAEAMIAFQESGDFTSFVNHRKAYDTKMKSQMGEEYIPQTHIFNNSPNSTFVSLVHTFGADADGQSTGALEVEIMDPQGVFEESMLDNSVDGFLDIKDNPVGAALLQKKEEILFQQSARQVLMRERGRIANTAGLGTAAKLREIDEKIASHEDTVEELESDIDAQAIESEGGISEDTNLEMINKQIQARTTQFQRPVFITYGCGENLKDWAPIQCFGKIWRVEYSFDGTGVRSFKLIFNPMTVSANLMRGFGIKPFGAGFAQGLITQGISDPIFNEESANAQADAFKSMVDAPTIRQRTGAALLPEFFIDKYIRDWKKPSLHLAVKTAIENFIKNGTNYDNVLVILPDLDHWLSEYFESCLRSVKWRIFGNAPSFATMDVDTETRSYMRAFEEALQGLGLTMGETLPKGKTGAVGTNVIGILEECGSAELAGEWYAKRNIFAKMECDYISQTFLEKLEQVGATIQTTIEKYNNSCPKLSMMTETIDVEVDFGLLRLMEEAGIIPSAAKPCVMWGSKTLKANYIEARLMEYTLSRVKKADGQTTTDPEGESLTTQDLAQFSDSRIQKMIHPLDQLKGLDVYYMESVINYILPVAWIGPFGPQNSGQTDEFALPNDANQTNTSLSDLKRSQPYKASRMPVFTFGTRNPNVISVDFDIDGLMLTGMNTASDYSKPSQGAVAGIIPSDFKTTAQRMFDDMDQVDVNDVDANGTPKGFKKLVKEFYDSDWFSGDDVEDFDEWSAIFDQLGDDSYKNISDKTFTGDNSEEDFYAFMWKAFQALYTKIYPTPTSIRNLPGSAPSLKTISNSAAYNTRMVNNFVKGTIGTTPMFNLSTPRTALSRSCLLYCIEPRFSGTNNMGNTKGNTTWFSGLYSIVGWKHTITGSKAESAFTIVKNAGKGTKLIKDLDSAIEGGSLQTTPETSEITNDA